MHALIPQSENWTLEILADDSDQPDSHLTLEKELQGCIFIKEVRDNSQYAGEIRYEEQIHNERIYVEAIVFTVHPNQETTEKDVRYFRRSKFEGDYSKGKAAKYAHDLKQEIDDTFF